MEYLIEIGTEELPAGTTGEIASNLQNLVQAALTEKFVQDFQIELFSTPRRIALLIFNLPAQTASREEIIKGPAPSAPPTAIEGFAKKNSVKLEELQEIDGRLSFKKTIAPVPIQEILSEALNESLSKLSGERWMTWGEGTERFSRPVKWVLSLLGDKVFDLQLFGIKADRKTRVNRLLEAESKGIKFIEISKASDYAETLRKNLVEPSRDERRKSVLSQIEAFATAKKEGVCQVEVSDNLLEEVVDLLEWPLALIGGFEKDFLALPDFLVETVLEHHQRYFPCYDENGKLINKFVFISNSLPEAQNNVVHGNERVLRARLKDAEFFVSEDLKQPLIARKEKLSQMTFQKELSEKCSADATIKGKAERILELCKKLADLFSLNSEEKNNLIRAAELAKCDLASAMVFEFPELQGLVGGFIVERQNENATVAKAISEQYMPLGAGKPVPESKLGALLSVADKLDNLSSLFAIGKIPSGSADPFALRRQAQGLFEILSSEALINLSARPTIAQVLSVPELKSDKLLAFVVQRVVYLLSQEFDKELVEAMVPDNSGLDFSATEIKVLLNSAKVAPLNSLLALRRIFRILKNNFVQAEVNPNLFKENAERNLFDIVKKWQASEKSSQNKWSSLEILAEPIDQFFDSVMVEDPDGTVSDNRKALLSCLALELNKIFYRPDWDKLATYLEKQ